MGMDLSTLAGLGELGEGEDDDEYIDQVDDEVDDEPQA
jgi:hypothetical protein